MIINLQDTEELTNSVSILQDELTANNTKLYFDYQDGKYGYNTDPSRGADTFSPFRSGGDEFNNLTTVIDIAANNLPTINGSGYIYVKYLSGAINTISVYIDGNTKAFKFKNFSSKDSVMIQWPLLTKLLNVSLLNL